jgi:Protein of unknown function (DUF2997)
MIADSASPLNSQDLPCYNCNKRGIDSRILAPFIRQIMAEYQQIEYRIGPDGKVVERVIGGSGTRCTSTTQKIEQALGQVEAQELLPEYHDVALESEATVSQSQS